MTVVTDIRITKSITNPKNGFTRLFSFSITYDGGIQSHGSIGLATPLEVDTNEALAGELHGLGTALIQVAETPEALVRDDH